MSEPIRLGQIALSFHVAAAAVVTALLQRAGHDVVHVEAPHEDMYQLLGAGEVDLVCSAWLPDSHGTYIAPFADALLKLGVIYHPFCIWAVPEVTPANVRSVEDLANPEVAQLFRKRIQGIGPGAGISRFSREMVTAYKLGALGFHFENGSLDDCTGACLDAVTKSEAVIVPLWHPQWLHSEVKLRALEEPKGLLGGQDEATLVLRKDAAHKFSDHALALLTHMQLGNDQVSALDHAVSRGGLSPAVAAQKWLADNEACVQSWEA